MCRSVKKYIFIFLVITPFALRLIYCLDTFHKPYFQEKLLISFINHTFAQDIAEGKGSPYLLFRSPYYPLLISCIYSFLGVNDLYVKILQWILGGFSCLLVYWLGRIHFDERTARVGLFISSIFIPFVYFEGELLEQSVVSFFILAAVCSFSFMVKKSRARYFFALWGSLLYGIAYLMRPDMLSSLPVFLITFVFFAEPLRNRIIQCGVFIFASIAMIYVMTHPGIFLKVDENQMTINAAVNFYLGNNPNADGYNAAFYTIPNVRADHPEALKYHMDELTLAGVLYAKMETDNQLSSVAPYWFKQAFRFIRSSPVQYLKLELKKVFFFFNGFIMTNQKDIYFMRTLSPLLYFFLFNALICFPLGVLWPFSFQGMYAARKSGASLLLLICVPCGCLLTTLAFFHNVRFQYPALPFILLFSARGIVYCVDQVMTKNWKPVLVYMLLIIPFNADFFHTHTVRWVEEYFNLGTMYFQKDDYLRSKQFYKKSLEIKPDYMPSIINSAIIFSKTHNQKEGINFLTALDKKNGPSWAVMYSIAQLYRECGDTEKALEWGYAALTHFKDHPEIYLLIGSVYLTRNELDKAVKILSQGVERFPHASLLLMNLGSAYAMQGNHQDAVKWYYTVLSKTQHYPQAYIFLASSLFELKRFEEAAHVLEKGIVRYPRDSEMLFLLGRVYGSLNKAEWEKNCYRAILEYEPKNSEAMFQLARVLCEQKDYKTAYPFALNALKSGHPHAQDLIQLIQQNPGR